MKSVQELQTDHETVLADVEALGDYVVNEGGEFDSLPLHEQHLIYDLVDAMNSYVTSLQLILSLKGHPVDPDL